MCVTVQSSSSQSQPSLNVDCGIADRGRLIEKTSFIKRPGVRTWLLPVEARCMPRLPKVSGRCGSVGGMRGHSGYPVRQSKWRVLEDRYSVGSILGFLSVNEWVRVWISMRVNEWVKRRFVRFKKEMRMTQDLLQHNTEKMYVCVLVTVCAHRKCVMKIPSDGVHTHTHVHTHFFLWYVRSKSCILYISLSNRLLMSWC